MKRLLISLVILCLFSGFGFSQTCSPSTPITMPFTEDGAGQFCLEATCIAAPINSWNMTQLTINGVDFTNRWADCSMLPAPIDGKYYIVYNGAYSWSHFEANGTCCGGATAAPTLPPTSPPTAPPTEPPTSGPTEVPPTPPPVTYSLTVTGPGSSMTGISVSVSPPGASYSYPAAVTYTAPATVTITANSYTYPDGAVNLFTNWTGDLTGNANPATILVDGVKNVTAVYVHGDPTPSPTPDQPTQPPQAPVINSINPASGYVGTVVTITGIGFAAAGNTVVMQYGTGSQALQAKIGASSSNGTSITFTVSQSFCPACRESDPPCAAPCPVSPPGGVYDVFIQVGTAASNSVQFTMIDPATAAPTADPTAAPTADPTAPPTTPPTAPPTTPPTTGPTSSPTPTPRVTSTPTPTPTPVTVTTPPTVPPTADPTDPPTPTPNTDPFVEPPASVYVMVNPCVTPTTVTVNFSASTSINVASYNIYRSCTSGGPYTLVGSVTANGSTSYTFDASSTPSNCYAYVVAAVHTQGIEGAYSKEATIAVADCPAPTNPPTPEPTVLPPTNLWGGAMADAGTVSLTWNASASANVISYNVYRGTKIGGPYALVGSTAALSFNQSGLSGFFFYVVTAVNSSGQESVYSNEVSVTASISPAPTETPTPGPGCVTCDLPTLVPVDGTPGPTPLIPANSPPPALPTGGGAVKLTSSSYVVKMCDSFDLRVAVDTGTQMLAAYGFTITHSSQAIAINTCIGTSGVTIGADGFVSAVNATTPGTLKITGFDAVGKGPSSNLSLLTISCKALGYTGTGVGYNDHWGYYATFRISLAIDSLVDPATAIVGAPITQPIEITFYSGNTAPPSPR